METGMFKITLADGTILDSLRLNGNNYISPTKLTEDVFTDNLKHVTIEGPDGIQEFDDLELVQIKKYGNEYWFVLRQLSDQELRDLKMQANIEYIAMLTDIDLEEV